MERLLAKALIDALEAEVNNGGFDQFFFNDAGNCTEQTITALRAVGADRAAEIVSAAAARFPGGMPPADRFARQALLEKISPNADAFKSDDGAFYAYPDDLGALVERYVA